MQSRVSQPFRMTSPSAHRYQNLNLAHVPVRLHRESEARTGLSCCDLAALVPCSTPLWHGYIRVQATGPRRVASSPNRCHQPHTIEHARAITRLQCGIGHGSATCTKNKHMQRTCTAQECLFSFLMSYSGGRAYSKLYVVAWWTLDAT